MVVADEIRSAITDTLFSQSWIGPWLLRGPRPVTATILYWSASLYATASSCKHSRYFGIYLHHTERLQSIRDGLSCRDCFGDSQTDCWSSRSTGFVFLTLSTNLSAVTGGSSYNVHRCALAFGNTFQHVDVLRINRNTMRSYVRYW